MSISANINWFFNKKIKIQNLSFSLPYSKKCSNIVNSFFTINSSDFSIKRLNNNFSSILHIRKSGSFINSFFTINSSDFFIKKLNNIGPKNNHLLKIRKSIYKPLINVKQYSKILFHRALKTFHKKLFIESIINDKIPKDLGTYITKESPYSLVIEFRRFNKIIYPQTSMPYRGVKSYRGKYY